MIVNLTRLVDNAGYKVKVMIVYHSTQSVQVIQVRMDQIACDLDIDIMCYHPHKHR